jgi:integrase
LRYNDITPGGLVIRATKFQKTRLVPLHETTQAALDRYLQQRRPYAPFVLSGKGMHVASPSPRQ